MFWGYRLSRSRDFHIFKWKEIVFLRSGSMGVFLPHGGVVALRYISCIVGFRPLEMGRCALYFGFGLKAFYIYGGVVYIGGLRVSDMGIWSILGYLVSIIVVPGSTYMVGCEVLFHLWHSINSRGSRRVVLKSCFYGFRAFRNDSCRLRVGVGARK